MQIWCEVFLVRAQSCALVLIRFAIVDISWIVLWNLVTRATSIWVVPVVRPLAVSFTVVKGWLVRIVEVGN